MRQRQDRGFVRQYGSGSAGANPTETQRGRGGDSGCSPAAGGFGVGKTETVKEGNHYERNEDNIPVWSDQDLAPTSRGTSAIQHQAPDENQGQGAHQVPDKTRR